MIAKLHTYVKIMPAGRVLTIGLIATLAIAVMIAFAWMQAAQIISPPGLRVLDWFWRVASAPVLSRIGSELYMRALSGWI